MAERGHPGFANTDEERQNTNQGGHASHEKGAAHEFNSEGDASRRGSHGHAHATAQSGHASGGAGDHNVGEAGGAAAGHPQRAEHETSGDESTATPHRTRKTRGGTHDQHVTAGKKGGSRIRQLIELGYKYEQEHGIGPGQNERSKLAAKRRAAKSGGGEQDESNG